MIHAYPKIYNLGHPAIADLFQARELVIEEKVDGSQISFTVDEIRSKSAQVFEGTNDKLFRPAVAMIIERRNLLHPGWIYRGEALTRQKHNTLRYDRAPGIVIFDIEIAPNDFLRRGDMEAECERVGLEYVPQFESACVDSADSIRHLLQHTSFLGGTLIEGVVIKAHRRFGEDGKPLMGKFVSEAFKETHRAEWKSANPSRADIVTQIIADYTSPARWEKAVQHLRDDGRLESSPRDIGLLLAETQRDVLNECRAEISNRLFDHAWGTIRRGIVRGLPEWYKQRLLAQQFEEEQ